MPESWSPGGTQGISLVLSSSTLIDPPRGLHSRCFLCMKGLIESAENNQNAHCPSSLKPRMILSIKSRILNIPKMPDMAVGVEMSFTIAIWNFRAQQSEVPSGGVRRTCGPCCAFHTTALTLPLISQDHADRGNRRCRRHET